MKRPSIALACIAKNEAGNVKQLFDSVVDCVDEIYLADTGSTDGTQDIARSLGAHVSHFDWINDFGAARNASFDPVKTDFILWLDLDDVLENPTGFKMWRDDVMALADYWIATYHYTSDAAGKALCSFARERVVRRDKAMRWKYFVHEGILPISPYGDVKVQYTPVWAVRHMRTEADLLKDRSRNLGIFEGRQGELDARMKYYYGKELFEAGRPGDAIGWLGQALADKSLEMHDRILGMQYLCYAYQQAGQVDQALQIAHQGTLLSPNRAEFHALVGDSYLKQGRLLDALPAFNAAKACTIQVPQGFAGPIFHHEDMYTVYPRNQIARIHANMGDFGKAETEAAESFTRYAHPESKAILDEIQKIKSMTASYKDAAPCDDIVITCPPNAAFPWDADIAKEKFMGGSETAAIEMASWLHKLSGRPVKVFNAREVDKVCDGVEYISTNKLNEYMGKHKPWMHIAWRHTTKITDAPTFVWNHDLQTPGLENVQNYDYALALTPFHKRFMMATQGVPESKIIVTRNGLKPERFTGGPWEKDPWKFVFSSSPDRGLDRAMRVLDKVREKYPEIKLHVYYGIERLPAGGLKDLHDKLKAMMDERKEWVIYHGGIQQDELMREFKGAAYCVQPSDFIETSKITAMELACCGVYQITRAVGGCVDTLAEAAANSMASLVESECITEREYQVYIDEVCKAIGEEAYRRVKMDPEKLSWKTVAEEWLRVLPEMAGYGSA